MTPTDRRCQAEHPRWGRCTLTAGHIGPVDDRAPMPHCAVLDLEGQQIYQRWVGALEWPELPGTARHELHWAAAFSPSRRVQRGF
jgi:hypothetical protein